MQSPVAARIQQEISSNPVMMYSKSSCPFCTRAKGVLNDMNVKFTAIELNQMDEGMEIQDTLMRMTHQRTVPNIFIGGEHVGGCSELQNGVASGSVQQLFQKHSIAFTS